MKNREDIYKITSILLILDQFIKFWIIKSMDLYEKIKIIPSFFSIFYVQNTGAAFSLLKDNTIFIVFISVVIIVLLDRYIKKEKNFTQLSKLSLGLMLGGIFGNLMDRIIHHAVIDYLSFTIFHYEFPVFNLADIGITVGAFLLIVDSIKNNKKGEENERNIRRANHRS